MIIENQHTQLKSDEKWIQESENSPKQKTKILFGKYLETENDLRSKIEKITTMINEEDPTFSLSDEESNENNAGLKDSRTTMQNLVIYYNSLSSILIKNRLNHSVDKQIK